ncbi:MAG: 16S rRNA (adenine(1518)-N(6)/adenine(1519)-N(6))-dimethyltransferase RsmA [Chlorobi bacterium]|nr:16S rRNA (adenine(1518)-N(6)/adenine(1519)-N(6))-dimethyltransferase RsmA [Chlorobiota bacterium]
MHSLAVTGVSPRRRLSQNFLLSSSVARRIAEAVGAAEGDVVVEIGAGTGALTRHLVTLPAAQVVAIEVDRRAVEHLRTAFGDAPSLRIVEANVLDVRLDSLDLPDGPIRVVGNIPYHLTGPIVFWLYEQAALVRRIVLMVQKEVAARIVAKPGSKTYGILSVATALVASSARVLFDVPPGAFLPRPKVTSSVVAIECNGRSLVEPELARTMRLVKAAFNQRRKKLRNALARYLEESVGADWERFVPASLLDRRAEELSVADFRMLADVVHRGGEAI